ncbi:MAG: hypothetical protein RMI89_00930 [Gloeomargarita sp. SKYBB_i_bin120]|nr:hypothetical protein [Gloeomargarita sp. SKYG98]MCS7291525.1 hypothetical protein [Gloeomargarita sp. SKYB120]MDW8177085.1 hypothetical protein [Gloeomargarita sp. SKYBB_i_bin120]
MSPFWRNFWLAFALSLLLTAALMWLDGQNLLSSEFHFVGAKGMIAAQGPDPRLSAIGFAFPALLIYVTMLVGSPITTQVLLVIGLIWFMTWLVEQLPVSRLWRGVILLALLLNPAFWVMVLTSPTWTAMSLFLGLSVLLYWHLVQPRDTQYPLSVNLVLLGLTLAPLMLLRYECWWLVPVFGLLGWFVLKDPHPPLKLTVVLVTIFMPIIAILGFLYVNWLIEGNPFYFLEAAGNGLRWPGMGVWLESAQGLDALADSGTWLGQTLPVYYLLAGLVLWQSRDRWLARSLLLVLPILLMTIMRWQGNFLSQISSAGAFLILVPITLLQVRECRMYHLIPVGFLLGISLYSTLHCLQTQRLMPEEQLVWRYLTGKTGVLSSPVLRWRQQQIAQQEIADILFQRLRPGQRILLDDTVNFSFIYLLQDSRRFVLPHQYEFNLALSRPEDVVDYILVRRETTLEPLSDQIFVDEPSLQKRFGSFVGVASNDFYQLFQRVSGER